MVGLSRMMNASICYMRPDLTEELGKQVRMSRRELFGVDDDIEAAGDVARRIDTP